METEETFRKFGINIGRFRTKEEILADRTTHKISLAESSKKDNTDQERHAGPQGRPIKEAFDRSKAPQLKRVLPQPMDIMFMQEDLS